MHLICEVGVGLRKRAAPRLHCSYMHGPFSTRMHAMWARVGQPACLLARERMAHAVHRACRERTGLLPFHVGPGWHVTSTRLRSEGNKTTPKRHVQRPSRHTSQMHIIILH